MYVYANKQEKTAANFINRGWNLEIATVFLDTIRDKNSLCVY